MKSTLAFTKKEFTAHIRSGKVFIFGGIFILLGIMNPAFAKLTPWLLDVMSEALAESGMNIAVPEATALDSWLQFYKNISTALIVFVIVEGNLFTREYRSGTLVLSLTKGLERYKVIIAKTIVMTTIWTVGYLLCFGITYGMNCLFAWDNSIAKNLIFSMICWWIFGMMFIAMIVLFSSFTSSSALVMAGSGGILVVSTIISIIPKADKFLPTTLSDGTSLIYGMKDAEDYVYAVIITVAITVAAFVASIPLFNKKQL